MKKVLTAGVLCLFLATMPVWSQQVSEKKEIAVFNLSYYEWDVPQSALALIDNEIKNVFVNIGRFDVIGMTYRLGDTDVNDFVEKIKGFKEQNAEIPEQVQMGQEFFTEADLNKLIASFIVVIPSVVSYKEEWKEADSLFPARNVVTLKASFSFVNVETLKTIAHVTLDLKGEDPKLDAAQQKVADSINPQLTFEIRKIPEFQIKTGILEVHGSDVIIEFGKNMGLALGDEYQVIDSRVLPSGRTVTENVGLIMVRKIDEEVSYATVLYSDIPLSEGAQLKEVPRLGFETAAYGHVAVLSLFGASPAFPPILAGVRATLARFVYDFRPFVEVETPFQNWIGTLGIPLNLLVGGEYNLYLGRLQIAPRVSLGIGFEFDVNNDFQPEPSNFGGRVGVGISWLFTPEFKVNLEAGYLMWLSFDDSRYGPSYDGVFAGGGLSIKF